MMPSHQSRRAALPPDYQFPSHGVDCDCVTCRPPHWVMCGCDACMTDAGSAARQALETNYEQFVGPLEPTADTPWAV